MKSKKMDAQSVHPGCSRYKDTILENRLVTVLPGSHSLFQEMKLYCFLNELMIGKAMIATTYKPRLNPVAIAVRRHTQPTLNPMETFYISPTLILQHPDLDNEGVVQ